MLNIYRKVEKSSDNPYGTIEIDLQDLEDNEMPFLLCLSAQNNYDKSIYGTMRFGMQAARIFTSQEEAALIKVDDMPVNFLGLRFKHDNEYDQNYEEIVDKFLYPFLVGKGTNIEDVKKQARKINLLTYCDGTFTYVNAEARLYNYLQNDGFSDEEIKEILSQISLVAFGTMVDTSNLMATSVTFIDVNDEEITTERTDKYIELIQANGANSACSKLSNNALLYVYYGNTNHSMKEYLSDGEIVKPVLCSIITYFIGNAIQNMNDGELNPISMEEIFKMVRKYGNENESVEALLEQLDKELRELYGDVDRYTLKEAKLMWQLYALLKANLDLEREKSSFQNSIEYLQERFENLVSAVASCGNPEMARDILENAGEFQRINQILGLQMDTHDEISKHFYAPKNF